MNHEQEIKKEFQLERVVLFSDAVFAIIITIMVIEIKFPESLRDAQNPELRQGLLEIVFKLIGYATSFFLVAAFWVRHLKLFSFLKDYNLPLLTYNLMFLFAVSLFPFAVSCITSAGEFSSTLFRWGVDLYISITLATVFFQTLLTRYLIRNKTTLVITGARIEEMLQWKAQRVNLFLVPLQVTLVIVFNYLKLPAYLMMAPVALTGIINRQLQKKYYPGTAGFNLFRIPGTRKPKRSHLSDRVHEV